MTTAGFGPEGAAPKRVARNYPLAGVRKSYADLFIGPNLRSALADVLEQNGFPHLTEADQIDLQLRVFDFVFGRRTD